jgi:hypothetical protein
MLTSYGIVSLFFTFVLPPPPTSFFLPLYKITLSEAFKLRRQSPFTLMSAVNQAESGPAKPAANRLPNTLAVLSTSEQS